MMEKAIASGDQGKGDDGAGKDVGANIAEPFGAQPGEGHRANSGDELAGRALGQGNRHGGAGCHPDEKGKDRPRTQGGRVAQASADRGCLTAARPASRPIQQSFVAPHRRKSPVGPAREAEENGPGGTRTPNQAVMSGPL